MKQLINETGNLAAKSGSKWRARIIEAPILGSSGYYPVEVVRRDGPAAFKAGTQVFFNHPGATESEDRPERSVLDLAGKISSTPVMESDGLYADVEFYSWAADVVKEMGTDIGLSIRAYAEAAPGEVDGKPVNVITRLHEGLSVDLVTKAGAGGKLVSLLESARPTSMEASTITEAGTVAEAATQDRREQLRRAVRDAYEDRSRDVYVWLRDFDDVARLAWFEIDSSETTWQQSYTVADDDLSVSLTGERIEVRPVTQYHPVTAAGEVGETSPPNTTKEHNMPQIEEARLAELTAAADRVPTLEADLAAANQRAEAAEAARREAAREAFNTQVKDKLSASDLSQAARDRVADALALDESTDVPADAAQTIEAAITAERDYLAKAAQPAQRGMGFGGGGRVGESRTRTHDAWGKPITKEA